MVLAVSGATIVELAGQPKGVPVDYTVYDNANIEKLTICIMSGARIAAATTGDSVSTAPNNSKFAGIAATDKESGDGSTSLGLYTKGIFNMLSTPTIGAEQAIAQGNWVVISGANLIRNATELDALSGALIGKAVEDIAAGGYGKVAIGIY